MFWLVYLFDNNATKSHIINIKILYSDIEKIVSPPIKPEEPCHLNDMAMTMRMNTHGIAKHLARAHGTGLGDALAGDHAAAYYYEDRALRCQLLEGLGVLTQARCVAACQDASRRENRRIS